MRHHHVADLAGGPGHVADRLGDVALARAAIRSTASKTASSKLRPLAVPRSRSASTSSSLSFSSRSAWSSFCSSPSFCSSARWVASERLAACV